MKPAKKEGFRPYKIVFNVDQYNGDYMSVSIGDSDFLTSMLTPEEHIFEQYAKPVTKARMFTKQWTVGGYDYKETPSGLFERIGVESKLIPFDPNKYSFFDYALEWRIEDRGDDWYVEADFQEIQGLYWLTDNAVIKLAIITGNKFDIKHDPVDDVLQLTFYTDQYIMFDNTDVSEYNRLYDLI